MLKLLLLFSLSLHLVAMEIDYQTLEKIIEQNPQAYKEKVLLAKYYFKQENFLKATNLLDEVLQAQPKNSNALKLKEKLKKDENDNAVFREAGLSKPIKPEEAQKRLESYYSANNYQFFSNLYQALLDKKIKLADEYHVKASYIYLRDSRYKQSEETLNNLEYQNNIDATKIRADICYYIGKYDCAVKLYNKLYTASYSLEYAIKLMQSYIYLGQIQKAQGLYNFVSHKNPKNSELIKIAKQLKTSKVNYQLNAKKAYEKDKNFKTLNVYTNALFSAGERKKAIETVHDFYKKNPTKDSLLLEAKYHMWAGNNEDAIKLLENDSLKNSLEAKLMLGQVYSWNQQFEKSKINLNEVIQKSKNKELLYNAKKARAYVYMIEKEKIQAKKLFKKLQKENPKDKEVQEALMELESNYAELIKIYKKRVATSHKPSDIKHLGELFTLNKEPKKAIAYLKDYISKNPNDLETTKSLALLLIKDKEYYQGFGYLEYYATQKDTTKALLLLAKNYYWQGFSKEALDVLGSLLKKDSENKDAIKLKASILKLAPRFTMNKNGTSTSAYFENLGKKQLFLADTLYFNAHYKAALEYYQNYLQMHPNDHEARYRYAFALENAKEYGKAEGEFSLLFGKKDSDELRYHYAYNMMRNQKLDKSKELLLKLKSSIYAPLDPKLKIFIESWKKDWQSMKFPQYARNYDKKLLDNELWSFKKQQTFANATFIRVEIVDARSKKIDDNNYIVKFYQKYSTNKHADKGYKTLHVRCDKSKTECKITKESWKAGIYKKSLQLEPAIERSLKEWEYLKLHPLAFSSKKKTLCMEQNQKSIMI